MWTDTIWVRSEHNVNSDILELLHLFPLNKGTTFWGDDVPIEKKQEISTIVIVDFKYPFKFLVNLPPIYRREECFFVLVATENYCKMLENASSHGETVRNILELKKIGKLTMICTDSQTKNGNVPVAIIIEMLRLSSWNKKMYVMSRGKGIKTAIFIIKELFNIDIEANYNPKLKHEPSINTCKFICHQMLDLKSENFRKMHFQKKGFPLKCTFIDMDNIKLNQSEIDRMELNNLVINCKNPPQATHNSTHVRLDHMSNCIDIEVPVVDDCGDIVLIFIMVILHSSLPVTVPFVIRSKDKIFLAAKSYLSKESSRQITLPDIDRNISFSLCFLKLSTVLLAMVTCITLKNQTTV